MHATIDRAGLMTALDRVKGALPGGAGGILAHFLLVADDDALRITATDGDLRITAMVPAQVDRPGMVAACGRLYDVVRRIPDGAQVQIEAGPADRMRVTAARARFDLLTTSADNFPTLTARGGHVFSLPAADLHTVLSSVAFAQSTEDARHYLNGTFLHLAARADGTKVLRAVATDGHRLARMQRPCPPEADGAPSCIIPRTVVGDIIRLVEGVNGPVDVAISENLIQVSTDSVELVAKLIDATFPDYNRVIPGANDRRCAIDAKLLAGAVDRVITLAEAKTRVLRATFARAGLTLACSSPDVGSAVEDVECEYNGPPMEIGFNGRYLGDILRRMTGEGAHVELGDAAGAVLFRDPAEADALYVLMPTRV